MERNANIYYNIDGIPTDTMEGKTPFSNQPTNLLYKKTIVT